MSGRRGDLVMGVPREALRPSPIFLCLVAVFGASGWMAWSDFGNIKVDVFLFVVSGWVVSLCLHEYAHAVIAFRSGDVAVAQRGYLTLNPFKYAHPVLSIVLPVVFILLGGIGLPGGAVWVDHGAIRGRWRESLLSLAGPGVNVVFAVALIAPLALGVDVAAHHTFWAGVAFLAFLQLTGGVLNLLPIPGLDGGNALRPWLSYRWRRGFDMFAPYGMLLVFALLWSGRFGGYFFTFVVWLGDVLGMPGGLAGDGLELFRLWTLGGPPR